MKQAVNKMPHPSKVVATEAVVETGTVPKKEVATNKPVPSADPATVTNEPVSANIPSGKWNYRTEVSKIDDSTNAYLSLQSEQPIEGRFGKAGFMTFSILCREHKTDLFFTLPDNL